MLVFASGCGSFADYRAQGLPPELAAVEGPPSNRVDLTALARRSINQNLIYPGDLLQVTIATGLEEKQPQSWSLRVSDDGAIDVPLVGAVTVVGLGLVDAEAAIRQASVERQIYRRPHVAVAMRQRKTIQVRVVGAVQQPGVHALPAAGSDLLAALVAAGGLADEAGTQIEIRHPTQFVTQQRLSYADPIQLVSFEATPDAPPRIVRLDLARLGAPDGQAELPQDLHVEDGTVIMVRQREANSVSVIGLVRRPDTYEMPDGEALRLLDAIALAGGPTVPMADKVRVIRHPEQSADPISIGVSLRVAKRVGRENLVLADGDIVVVEETPLTMAFETVRGFIRFGFTSAIPGL